MLDSVGASSRVTLASDRTASDDRAVVIDLATDVLGFAVADGAGGLGGGARAAEIVVRSFGRALATGGRVDEAGWWTSLLRTIDLEIEHDREAGESTAVVGIVDGERLVGASVGDSEAWLIGPDSVLVVTDAQHRRPRLGTGVAKPVSFGCALDSRVLLVGTDGLFGSVAATAICHAIQACTPRDRATQLIMLARGRSGRLYDDLGFVILGQ